MDLQGAHSFDAPPQVIWRALLNPKVLKACIPGAKTIRGSVTRGYQAEVETQFGPMTVGFRGDIAVTEIVPCQSISLKGKSRGLADITLETRDGKTLLTYHVSVTIGGRFGRLGEGVVTTFAETLVATFFAELTATLIEA